MALENAALHLIKPGDNSRGEELFGDPEIRRVFFYFGSDKQEEIGTVDAEGGPGTQVTSDWREPPIDAELAKAPA